jgi:hypothetical protein
MCGSITLSELRTKGLILLILLFIIVYLYCIYDSIYGEVYHCSTIDKSIGADALSSKQPVVAEASTSKAVIMKGNNMSYCGCKNPGAELGKSIHCTCPHSKVHYLCYNGQENLTCCKEEHMYPDHICANPRCSCTFHGSCLPKDATIITPNSRLRRLQAKKLQHINEAAKEHYSKIKNGNKNDMFKNLAKAFKEFNEKGTLSEAQKNMYRELYQKASKEFGKEVADKQFAGKAGENLFKQVGEVIAKNIAKK